MEKLERKYTFNALDIKKEGVSDVSMEISPADFADAFPGRNVIRKAKADLTFSTIEDGILLSGNIAAALELECSRCGEPVLRDYDSSFDECFNNSVEYINVYELIRETLSLMEPMKVLCSENCKGRCPQCGADLNKEKCSCEQEIFSPLADLKKFKPGK